MRDKRRLFESESEESDHEQEEPKDTRADIVKKMFYKNSAENDRPPSKIPQASATSTEMPDHL